MLWVESGSDSIDHMSGLTRKKKKEFMLSPQFHVRSVIDDSVLAKSMEISSP